MICAMSFNLNQLIIVLSYFNIKFASQQIMLRNSIIESLLCDNSEFLSITDYIQNRKLIYCIFGSLSKTPEAKIIL